MCRPILSGTSPWAALAVLALAAAGLAAGCAAPPLAPAEAGPPASPVIHVVSPTPLPTAIPYTPTPPAPTAALNPPTLAAPTDPPDPCALYHAELDLLTVVDKDHALARDYEPPDLAEVPLDPDNVGYRPLVLRQPVHDATLDLLAAMNETGLRVWAMSGYRSYSEQTLAYEKWQAMYPDRVVELSAQPGHSEHQLGTAIDFTNPGMVDLFGDFFHIKFAQLPEGLWLAEHAVEYGFTLSFPADAVETTGFAWEPWHYRYVGPALAQELAARTLTLTEYLASCAGE
jgi:D-alanyl-D-alanine carboxypeptidase